MSALQQADLTARKLAIKVLPAGAKRKILRQRRQLVNTYLQCRALAGHTGTLPAFLIIGGQKCGTTDLHDRLVRHPLVRKGVLKEIDYFQVHYGKGPAWYRSHFPDLGSERAQPNGSASLVTGEASGYLSYAEAPQRIKAELPDVKMIALLRDPVKRAYSHYNHVRRLGIEPANSFEEALELERRCVRGTALDDPPELRYGLGERSYLSKGLYAEQLAHWYASFPSEQLLVVASEDFYRDTRAMLLKVSAFLELPDWEPEEYQGHKQFAYEPMQPDTSRWLAEYYRPHNERLFELLGTEYRWTS